MALEDLQSQYGPTNKKGQRGTGETFDTLANEGTVGTVKGQRTGLIDGQSKYADSSKNGKKPSGPDPFGNIPAERSYE
jgi:hypothetical protein